MRHLHLNAKAYCWVNAQSAVQLNPTKENRRENQKVKIKKIRTVAVLGLLGALLGTGCTASPPRPNHHWNYEMREPGGPRRQ
jgi:hypothetical protein